MTYSVIYVFTPFTSSVSVIVFTYDGQILVLSMTINVVQADKKEEKNAKRCW